MSITEVFNGLFRRTLAIFRGQFDPEACIRLLLDKSEAEVNRLAAAESLGYDLSSLGHSVPRAVEALYSVAADASNDLIIREEAAQSLGFIWAKIGVDRVRLNKLPEDMRNEVLASIRPEDLKEV